MPYYRSRREGHLVEAESARTFAEGLASRSHIQLDERLAGKNVGTILSGGNLLRHMLERALTDPHSW